MELTDGNIDVFFNADRLKDWEQEVENIDTRSDWDRSSDELFNGRYSYIKLGLLLTKIRNTCGWKYCGQKFKSFKDWCRAQMHLPIWQVNLVYPSQRNRQLP